MAKFEILESLNYRGGNHYCYVFANDTNEIIEELKDAWYSSGIHRHGGELFLCVCVINFEGKEVSLNCGNASVDKEGELYSSFSFPYQDNEKDEWFQLGLFLENNDTDYFETVLDVFFDYDSPDRVLGSYLYRVSKLYKNLSVTEKKNFGKNVLAEILSFAKSQNKCLEMYEWLISKEGSDYLEQHDHLEPAGLALVNALDQCQLNNINEFIGIHKKDFELKILLPSTIS